MTSRQLPMKQFAAIVTGQIGPPWRLAIQPGHPAGTRVSLRSLIAELSATEVIVFLELRSPAIFSFSSGTLSVDMQEYLFARSYLSRDDLHALLELCSSLDLSLVSIRPDWTAVGIQGTMGNISQIGFAPVTAVSVQQPPGGGPNPGGAAANPGAVTMTVSNNKGIVWPGVAIAGGGGAATAGWLGLGVVWKAILGGDLAETAAIPELVRSIRQQCGAIYGLVNNAGIGTSGVLANMRVADIERTVQLNTVSPMVLTKHVVRAMMSNGAKAGRIVNISSIVAGTGFSGLSVYGATKASLIGFTKSLARELGPLGITVNAVAPGFVDTRMTDGLEGVQREQIMRRSPLKRLVEAEDVAETVAFLLSDAARNITGTVMTVDAGSTA